MGSLIGIYPAVMNTTASGLLYISGMSQHYMCYIGRSVYPLLSMCVI